MATGRSRLVGRGLFFAAGRKPNPDLAENRALIRASVGR